MGTVGVHVSQDGGVKKAFLKQDRLAAVIYEVACVWLVGCSVLFVWFEFFVLFCCLLLTSV